MVLLIEITSAFAKGLEIIGSYFKIRNSFRYVLISSVSFWKRKKENNKSCSKVRDKNEVQDLVYLGCKFTSLGMWIDQVQLFYCNDRKASWLSSRSPLKYFGAADIKLLKRIFRQKQGELLFMA